MTGRRDADPGMPDGGALLSVGLHGATPHDTIVALAPRLEQLGFHALWLNDVPGGDSLAGLRVAADVTSRLRLGSGVIPLDRRPASGLDVSALPADRLTLGIGAGRGGHPLSRVRDAIDDLSSRTTARIYVGALGPKMRRLGAEKADGVLLNWLPPAEAEQAMADLHRDAHDRTVSGAIYVRTIVDAGALPTLKSEASTYESFPSYAANFARLGVTAMQATIRGREDLAPYLRAVDEVVLRAITPDATRAQLEDFVETVARWRGQLA
ncbi:LLM class flavin-dependent oxidoreductase [Mycetocola sp. 2940]|uniref:LLM class flavin-dependent oxidoreductase n=1 Tax=Mycetocola sp. 2940 TaxID=3156452 RepID=UPI003392EFB0